MLCLLSIIALPALSAEDIRVAVGKSPGVPAFPGAEGAGAYAVGGRGGTVYRVTNLNAAGPGSLADAVSQPHRIIVFAVCGSIDLRRQNKEKGGRLVLDQPHITIAGQTAPGEGICVIHGGIHIQASDVIVRYLRIRRGYVCEGDAGDCVDAKPRMKAATELRPDESPQRRAKLDEKKQKRGKFVKAPAESLENIILDHVSTSWATDENMTITHPNLTTAQYCIIAEGLDYANPKQTPPRHSEGSLWGVAAADGRSTFHHNLYAHNRLRNPRTTGGDRPFAVLEFRNNVVYNAAEYFSHTGGGPVFLNWLDNYYKSGPSTPASLRGEMFQFVHSRESRMYARGNIVDGVPAATADNWQAVRYGKGLTPEDEKVLRVNQPFPAPPMPRQSAAAAYAAVLAEAGATLPSRDSVDLRIINDVLHGTGRIIEKETDLPLDDRWPNYHSFPAPADSDGDGLPDYWEDQFGTNKRDPHDAMTIAAGGYARIEHYLNNTDPTGGATPIVHIAGIVSRARRLTGQAGILRVTRSGDLAQSLTVSVTIGGTATPGRDYTPLPLTATIPAGIRSTEIAIIPSKIAQIEKTVIVNIETGKPSYHIGCPCAALVVIQD